MSKSDKKPAFRRKKQLIKPRLQWKLMLVFACVAACSVLLQSITLAGTVSNLADQLPHDGNILMGKVMGFLWLNLLITLACVLPLHLIVGRTVTFKIAGPIYRFETYLKQLIRGEQPGPCKIRKDDELQDFCELLNQAVETIREKPQEQREEGPAPPAVLPSNVHSEETTSAEAESENQARESETAGGQ